MNLKRFSWNEGSAQMNFRIIFQLQYTNVWNYTNELAAFNLQYYKLAWKRDFVYIVKQLEVWKKNPKKTCTLKKFLNNNYLTDSNWQKVYSITDCAVVIFNFWFANNTLTLLGYIKVLIILFIVILAHEHIWVLSGILIIAQRLVWGMHMFFIPQPFYMKKCQNFKMQKKMYKYSTKTYFVISWLKIALTL